MVVRFMGDLVQTMVAVVVADDMLAAVAIKEAVVAVVQANGQAIKVDHLLMMLYYLKQI
jgi:hypothetical protein